MLFGDPERRRRKKQQEDLDANYYKRQKAFNQAKEEQRIKNAKAAGIASANKISNRKPFYLKILSVAKTVGKDVVQGASKTDPNVLFSFDGPKKPRRKRKKKR
jgi:hypothetical protein